MHRKNLTNEKGKEYWQSQEEWNDSPEFREIIQREFPVDASVFSDPMSRRKFFKIMGASLSLAGLSGCQYKNAENIVGYVKAPLDSVPGKSVYYARSFNRNGHAQGVLVECFMGRPIKIEGNPEHPMSLGGCDVITQAEILNLYDPDRLQFPIKSSVKKSWEQFQNEWENQKTLHQSDQGEGLMFVCARTTSPTFFELESKIIKKYPKAKFHYFDPLSRENQKRAMISCFGKDLTPFYLFRKAERVLSFDNDFISDETAGVRYAHDFSEERRQIQRTTSPMNRLYVFESDFSLSGSMADHRFCLPRADIEKQLFALAKEAGITGVPEQRLTAVEEKRTKAIARDLLKHRGKSIILAGTYLSSEAQMAATMLNIHLQNMGSTVLFYPSFLKEETDPKEIAHAIKDGKVRSLFFLSSNFIYESPADLAMNDALKRVPFSVCLATHQNETSDLCQWTLPESHPFESWSDARSQDGLLTINQPMIEPLFATKNEIELLALLLADTDLTSHDIVKNSWKTKKSVSFEQWWQETLSNGIASDEHIAPLSVAPATAIKLSIPEKKIKGDSKELHFRPDPALREGRYANNGWLQELPRPMSKICWGNAVFLSPVLAEEEKIENGDEVILKSVAGEITIPAWVLPGLAKKTLVIHFGHGRKISGHIGTGHGSNAFALLHSEDRDNLYTAVEMKKTGKKREVACTQNHHSFESRSPIHVHAIAEREGLFRETPPSASLISPPPIPPSDQYAWGMSIDLNVCNGCSACVLSCQAENNIPIVGKEEVSRGREMHWLRIDRYFSGKPDLASAYFQPLACVQCEKAPCEIVCPVAATTHSSEGINQMIYNRCVGTRFCSNNCPYKVRRFNFLDHQYRNNEIVKMQANPEVSVRSRGIMEKCTYCIQRINEMRVEAEKKKRKIEDGEIKTACQQVCPTKAIEFGNLLDKNSTVSKRHALQESYALLNELGTLPRTRYLAKFINKNPELNDD